MSNIVNKPHLTLDEVLNRPVVGNGHDDQGTWDDLWSIALDHARPFKERADAIRHMDILTGEPESAGKDDIALVYEAENAALDIGAPLTGKQQPSHAEASFDEQSERYNTGWVEVDASHPDDHPENHHEHTGTESHVTAGEPDGQACSELGDCSCFDPYHLFQPDQ